ncbi:MAG: hypothetical protein AAF823_00035 [Planctomycetota bacterium]
MAQSQSSKALLALSTFLGLMFVACLVLAVVFYISQADLQQRAEQAEADLSAVATNSELAIPSVQALRQGSGTVVGQLLDENESLKATINADPGITLEALDTIVDGLDISGSLIGTIRTLQQEVAFANEQREAAQTARDAANERAQTAEADRDAIRAQFDQSVQEARNQAQAQKEAADTVRNSLGGVQSDLTGQLAEFRNQQARNSQELQSRIAELERANRELNDELVTQKLTGQYAKAITSPDGRIVSVPSDDDKVFINIGSLDRVIPGMTFEVFRAGELIGLEDGEFDSLRGVATLEVITTEARTAMTRVVRVSRGQDVREGDVLVNLVYEPTAELRFHVFGSFDIDGSGEATTADRRRVESMIERWGGDVMETFSPDADFLVLGAEPDVPDALPPGTTDPVLIEQNVRDQQAYDQWQSLAAEASRVGVPVLNENRFLALIGFYER